MARNIKICIEQFELFYELLMKNKPEGYIPWFFKCEKENKNPLKGLSWHSPVARLDKEQCIKAIQEGYNLGLSARDNDSLIIIDIDNPKYLNQLPKNTLTTTSRKRDGAHAFCWQGDKTVKMNLPTDDGEIRSVNQYVLCPGSYVPVDNKTLVELSDEAKNDSLLGYYTIRNNNVVTSITLLELPQFFIQKYAENVQAELRVEIKKEIQDTNQKRLSELKVSDLVGFIPANKRQGHPLHNSDTDANFSLSKDGSLAFCWRHMVSLNALQYLAVESGICNCEDAGTPFKNGTSKIKGDKEITRKVYEYAAQKGLVKIILPKEKQKYNVESFYFPELLIEPPKEKDFFIDKLIPKEGVSFIASPTGIGKTNAAIHMSLCIVNEEPYLGIQTKKGKVLYIDEENSVNTMRRKVWEIQKGNHFISCEDIYLASFQGININTLEGSEKLKILIERHNPQIIILDPFIRTFAGIENDSDQVKQYFEALKPYLDSISFIILHHVRKEGNGTITMNSLRGSSDISGFADVVMVLDRLKSEGNIRTLKVVKHRHIDMEQIEPINMKFETETLMDKESQIIGKGLLISKVDYDLNLNEVQKAERGIIDYLIKYDLTEFKTGSDEPITVHVTSDLGIKIRNFRTAIKSLQEKKNIKIVKKGIYQFMKNTTLVNYSSNSEIVQD